MQSTHSLMITISLIIAATMSAAAYIGIPNPPPIPETNVSLSGGNITVVELFTSQACISCPPAEAFLTEMVEQNSDILGLEFHVTYWDDLVDGDRGRWKDIFADPAYTDRQAQYNQTIRFARNSYTPQMIIDGHVQAVGFDRDEVWAGIIAARDDSRPDPPRIDVSINDNMISIAIVAPVEAPSASGNIWLVHYDKVHTTGVTSGENQGRSLVNRNVVTDLKMLGLWQGASVELDDISFSALATNQACAIIVQGSNAGRILAAARCPETSSLN